MRGGSPQPGQPGQGLTLVMCEKETDLSSLFFFPLGKRGPCHLPPLSACCSCFGAPFLSGKGSLHSPNSSHGQQRPALPHGGSRYVRTAAPGSVSLLMAISRCPVKQENTARTQNAPLEYSPTPSLVL